MGSEASIEAHTFKTWRLIGGSWGLAPSVCAGNTSGGRKNNVTSYPLKTEVTSFCSQRHEICFRRPAIRAVYSNAPPFDFMGVPSFQRESDAGKYQPYGCRNGVVAQNILSLEADERFWHRVLVLSSDAKPVSQCCPMKTTKVNKYLTVATHNF